MKVLVTTELSTLSSSSLFEASYGNSVIPFILKHRYSAKLYYDDKNMQGLVEQYGFEYQNTEVQDYDVIVVTHATSNNIIKELISRLDKSTNKPVVIYEDGDDIKSLYTRFSNLDICDLLVRRVDYKIRSQKPSIKIITCYYGDTERELEHLPGDYENWSDLVWVGNPYYKERVERLSKIDPNIKVDIYGTSKWQSIDLPDNFTYKGYSNYKSLIAPYKFSLIDFREPYIKSGFITPKISEAVAAGHIPLVKRTIGSERFTSLKAFLWDNPEDIGKIIKSCNDWEFYNHCEVLWDIRDEFYDYSAYRNCNLTQPELETLDSVIKRYK